MTRYYKIYSDDVQERMDFLSSEIERLEKELFEDYLEKINQLSDDDFYEEEELRNEYNEEISQGIIASLRAELHDLYFKSPCTLIAHSDIYFHNTKQ